MIKTSNLLCILPILITWSNFAFARCPISETKIPMQFNYKLRKDIPYCKGLPEQRFDIAHPDGSGVFPAIIFIHGGAWSGGSRKDFQTELDHSEKYNLLKSTARRGFIAVSIDYRTTQGETHRFPVHLDDVNCALGWLKENAKKYQINSKKIGLFGFSAGGHLSLMAGLNPRSGISAVASWAGPTDLVALSKENLKLKNLIANVFQKNLKDASPVNLLVKTSIPIQTLHGDLDDTVFISQAQYLDDRAKKVGSSHELIICPGLGHGFEDPTGKSQKHDNELVAFEHTLRFFNTWLK